MFDNSDESIQSVNKLLKQKEKRVVIPTRISETALLMAKDCAKARGVTLRSFIEAAILFAKNDLSTSDKDFSLQNKKDNIK